MKLIRVLEIENEISLDEYRVLPGPGHLWIWPRTAIAIASLWLRSDEQCSTDQFYFHLPFFFYWKMCIIL